MATLIAKCWTCYFELEGDRFLTNGLNREMMPVYRIWNRVFT